MKIFFGAFFVLLLSFGLNAQSVDDETPGRVATLGVSFSAVQTNSLLFGRNYNFDFLNDIYSSNTTGYSVSIRRTQSIFGDNLNWFAGGRIGLHAYSFNLLLSQDFRDLGTGFDYPHITSKQSRHELFFVDVLSGLRYDFPIAKRMRIGVEVTGMINYHFKNDIQYDKVAFVDMDPTQGVTVLSANMMVNPDNSLNITSQVGITYLYHFKNGGLQFSANMLMASKRVLIGNYQIFGDDEILEGAVTKDFSSVGYEIGYFWNLKN